MPDDIRPDDAKHPGAISDDEFMKLIEGQTVQEALRMNEVVEGTVVKVTKTEAFVDIGAKSEGVLSLAEFKDEEIKPGDKIKVYVEQIESEGGLIKLSKDKADFLLAWDKIKEAYQDNLTVDARVIKQVKGGFIVEVFGVEAFLPGSQVDIRKVRNFNAFIGKSIPVKVIKLNKLRKNIVVSRKEVQEEELERARARLMEIQPDTVVEGVVKTITEFGVFVDIGGIDGLIHISDLSWTRVHNPSDVVSPGERVRVKVLSVDPENMKLSLGLKHMTPHPWERIAEKYRIGSKVKGKITSLVEFGAFVELEPGVEGLIHISEMVWGRPPAHPRDILQPGQEVEAIVLNVDIERQRISLGLKQATPDPWADIEKRFPVGSDVEAIVQDFDSYGAYLEIDKGVQGYLHISNISWTKRFSSPEEAMSRNQRIKVRIIDIDKRTRLMEVSLKHTRPNPWDEIKARMPEGSEIKAVISSVTERGVSIKIDEGLEGFVPQSHLQKRGNPKDNYSPGQEINLVVLEVEPERKRIVLSERNFYKAKEAERKEELAARFKPEPARLNLGEILKAELDRLEELKGGEGK
ncbi:MAG: 30S ribosomal protein S1 [candidate division WOR-3 bacterium]